MEKVDHRFRRVTSHDDLTLNSIIQIETQHSSRPLYVIYCGNFLDGGIQCKNNIFSVSYNNEAICLKCRAFFSIVFYPINTIFKIDKVAWITI